MIMEKLPFLNAFEEKQLILECISTYEEMGCPSLALALINGYKVFDLNDVKIKADEPVVNALPDPITEKPSSGLDWGELETKPSTGLDWGELETKPSTGLDWGEMGSSLKNDDLPEQTLETPTQKFIAPSVQTAAVVLEISESEFERLKLERSVVQTYSWLLVFKLLQVLLIHIAHPS